MGSEGTAKGRERERGGGRRERAQKTSNGRGEKTREEEYGTYCYRCTPSRVFSHFRVTSLLLVDLKIVGGHSRLTDDNIKRRSPDLVWRSGHCVVARGGYMQNATACLSMYVRSTLLELTV